MEGRHKKNCNCEQCIERRRDADTETFEPGLGIIRIYRLSYEAEMGGVWSKDTKDIAARGYVEDAIERLRGIMGAEETMEDGEKFRWTGLRIINCELLATSDA